MAGEHDPRDGYNPDDDSFDPTARRKKSGNGPIIAMIGLGVLLVGGLIFALYYFLGRDKVDSEMLAYLPKDTNVIAGVEVEEMLKNDKLKELWKKLTEKGETKQILDKLKQADLDENDISKVMFGGGVKTMEPGDSSTIVVRLKKDVNKEKLAKAFDLKETEKNGKKFYTTKVDPGTRIILPTDRLIVVVQSEKRLDEILGKDPGNVLVSDSMQELAHKMSKGALWVAIDRSSLGDSMKDIEKGKGAKDPDGELLMPDAVIDAVKDLKGLGFYLKVEGDKASLKTGLLCKDSDAASKAADELKKLLDKHKKDGFEKSPLFMAVAGAPKEVTSYFNEILQSASVESSGAMLETTLNASIAGTEKAVRYYFERDTGMGELKLMINEKDKPADPLKEAGFLENKKKDSTIIKVKKGETVAETEPLESKLERELITAPPREVKK